MCCETGVCGVGVDPELIRISAALNALKDDGVEVKRYNLSSSPEEFVNNKVISRHVSEKGTEGLPAVMLDEEIVIFGRYPTNKEITNMLGIPENYLADKNLAQKKRGGG